MIRSQHRYYEAFVLVVEQGSITAVASALNLPRPTVSRYLTRLEADLGVALLHRTTRHVGPTTAGQHLYERVKPLIDAWVAAETEVAEESEVVRGVVRVSVLPLLGPYLAPVLAHLRQAHSQLSVEMVSSVHLPDLRNEPFDAAIWAGEVRDGDLVVQTLGTGNVGLVASADYLARHGQPGTVAELENHELLRGHSLSGRPRERWPLLEGGGLRVSGAIVSNDAHVLREMCLRGLGISLLSDLNVREPLADDRLLRVLPGVVGRRATVRLIVAQRDLMPSRLRVFVDAVAAHFDRDAVADR